MKKIKVIEGYQDKNEKRYIHAGEVLEVENERGEILKEHGVAVDYVEEKGKTKKEK